MVLKLETKQIYNQILNKDYILQMCMLCLVTCFPSTCSQAVNYRINTFKMYPILCAQGYFSLCHCVK